MSKNITIQDYLDSIPPILLDCQFIEECLRMYIADSYEIIKRKLNKSIPFKFSYADLKADALGVLIQKFRKFNNKQELVKKLKAVKDCRNFCAHKAYLLTYEEQKNEEYLLKATRELSSIKIKTKTCLIEIMKELNKITEVKKSLQQCNAPKR